MKLAILDDDGIIVTISGGVGMKKLERDLVGPLAERIANKVGILRKSKIQTQVEDEILAFFQEIKSQARYARTP